MGPVSLFRAGAVTLRCQWTRATDTVDTVPHQHQSASHCICGPLSVAQWWLLSLEYCCSGDWQEESDELGIKNLPQWRGLKWGCHGKKPVSARSSTLHETCWKRLGGCWADRTSSGSRPVADTRPVCDTKAKVRYALPENKRTSYASAWPRAADSALFQTIMFWERMAQRDLCPYARGSFTCPTFLDTLKTTYRLSFPVL
jgi:hypothetical protein